MICCVWVGHKYGREYVERLRNMCLKHSDEKYIVCLTDKPQESIKNVIMVDVSHLNLEGWWAKMALFSQSWRDYRVTYFDLDTVILGDIRPLLEYDGPFAICENFTRLAGNKTWPCKYGSCVMSIPANFGREIFDNFMENRDEIMEACGNKGDQYAIEKLVPDAVLLQDVLPNFFIGYREFQETKPGETVAIFAGSRKPDNSPFDWVCEAWI